MVTGRLNLSVRRRSSLPTWPAASAAKEQSAYAWTGEQLHPVSRSGDSPTPGSSALPG
jgi:hypothetical protein